VTEGINNAVRHGDADRIDITITEQDSGIAISIADNGTAGPPSGRRGTGTRLLDALAPQSWSRTINENGGTTLAAQIPSATSVN